jgi:hypothetical protein
LSNRTGEQLIEKEGMIGKTIGRLHVVSQCSRSAYKCKCDCGEEVVWNRSKIIASSSCGCIRRKVITPAFARYKKSAERIGVEFNLSGEDVDALTKGNCSYCGISPHRKTGSRILNGIDRVDSSLGYLTDNVVACCWECNRAKADLSVEDFLSNIRRIVNHQLSLDSNFLKSDT